MNARAGDTGGTFSRFYAVVLGHWAGGGRRIRWSTQHNAWVRGEAYGRYLADPWLTEPGQTFGRPDGPAEEDQVAASALANSVVKPDGRPFFCQRCWGSGPESHFIAPDVYGDPELYCVQMPAYSVVDSSGGSGEVKHWGSPYGCQSVDQSIDTASTGREPYLGPCAAYVFGRPLPADEVINRDWCSRCTGFASNVKHNAAERGEDQVEWARKETRRHVRRLSRSLAEYYGEQ
ncbi:hypothetical protein HH310_04300 [Actinoplanes sp. TBRC 11911]|uniref:hypothetical protein n=1 Tax=Actinoplanes sp. TBRC 11911 TaxID=2729386 RepID=UPI00145DD219|nr:hypothetical protein [Actinoplanes sp. TBRC 11911]NMO50413.1 hypothetical protein [Actinoplanes sp. TBRC 11911]